MKRSPRLTRSAAQSELAAALAKLRNDLGVPDGFPEQVEAEAKAAAARSLGSSVEDLREIDFCTIDPEGTTDLDQALHLTRDGDGMRVRYAIADVPWFVQPQGAVDTEARKRGQTLYAPDERAPLHPAVLSEDAASLLPDQDRQAFVWDFRIDSSAEVRSVELIRAVIRSRKQWTYEDAQQAVADGTGPESLQLMLPFGEGRQQLEAARGGASLSLPDGEVVLTDRGYAIQRRKSLPIEEANAQLSLMTGMAAAQLMLQGNVGILRTMPAAEQAAVDEFRHQTKALGLGWKSDLSYGDYLRGLDREQPAALAVLQAATALFRGAGYEAFDGAAPEQPLQAAIAAPYAHVTAPLRRLVDRFGLTVCMAVQQDQDVPQWARDALPELPKIMAASDELASRLDSGALNRVEAALLASRADETFRAVVLSRRDDHRRIQLADPAVTASINGVGEPGDELSLRLVSADIGTGEMSFELASNGPAQSAS